MRELRNVYERVLDKRTNVFLSVIRRRVEERGALVAWRSGQGRSGH